MPNTFRAIASRHRSGDVGSAWWLLRLVLVLVLAFDHLSAPFHQHGHEGLESHESVVAHLDAHDGDVHAVDLGDHPGSHAVMAIKAEPSMTATAVEGLSTSYVLAPPTVAQLMAASLEPPAEHWQSDRSRPDFRSHRSLPPAGRAPPLHA
jgi:hypothetical protein